MSQMRDKITSFLPLQEILKNFHNFIPHTFYNSFSWTFSRSLRYFERNSKPYIIFPAFCINTEKTVHSHEPIQPSSRMRAPLFS